MFKIKLLILSLVSLVFISCTSTKNLNKEIKYSVGYSGGEYDGLILKNILTNHLMSLNIHSKDSNLEIKPYISHSSNLYITNINNTSDRRKIESSLSIKIFDKKNECLVNNFDKNITQFYIFANSSKYISNNIAVEKIKMENTETLVKSFINSMNANITECKKIEILSRKLLSIRDE